MADRVDLLELVCGGGGMHLAAWEDGLSDASGRIFRVVNRGGGLFLQFSLVVA